MDHCRVCKIKIKPYQVFCPNCGAKHPLLRKGELKEFRIFKKKFMPFVLIAIVIFSLISILFLINIQKTETTPYNVKKFSSELKPVNTLLGCVEENFRYSMNYMKPEVFRGMLRIEYNLENFEDEQGTFEQTILISDKLTLKERQKSSIILLGPYENKTASVFFENEKSPDKFDYSYEIKPPIKKVCKTKTEHVIITKGVEETETEQKKIYKSLFEFIFEKVKK